MPQTQRALYVAAVKEDGQGRPFLMFEPMGGSMPILGSDGFVMLELKAGTTLEAAQTLAHAINAKIEGLAVTTF